MLNFINSLSNKKFVALSFVVSSLLSLPLLTLYIMYPTDTTISKAAKVSKTEDPVIISKDPLGTPKINGIKPFWGKAGDEVVIWGENFGRYPSNSFITISDIKATKYSKWDDNQIVFTIPENVTSGKISLIIGNSLLNWSKVFNVFNANTEPILEFKSGKLTLSNYTQDASTIFVWRAINGEPEIFNIDKTIPVFEIPKTFDRIEWISVEGSGGTNIPYLVNPINFLN